MAIWGADVLGFAAVAAVLTVTPGPDMVLVARHAASSGRRAAWATSAGVSRRRGQGRLRFWRTVGQMRAQAVLCTDSSASIVVSVTVPPHTWTLLQA